MQLSRREQTRAEFEGFVEAHADDLLRTGYLIAWDLSDAEDLVQAALARVARRWPRVRAMDQPLTYARRILVNLAIDDTKRRRRRRLELEPSDGPPLEAYPDEAAARVFDLLDTRAELLAALAALPPRQRVVLVLRYFEDLSEAQVAKMLNCSVGTAKSTASRGLARLREALEVGGASTLQGNGRLISETKEPQP